MKVKAAIQLAGSRDELARILNVEPATSRNWKYDLPVKHERYLRALRPHWFPDMRRDEPTPTEANPAVS